MALYSPLPQFDLELQAPQTNNSSSSSSPSSSLPMSSHHYHHVPAAPVTASSIQSITITKEKKPDGSIVRRKETYLTNGQCLVDERLLSEKEVYELENTSIKRNNNNSNSNRNSNRNSNSNSSSNNQSKVLHAGIPWSPATTQATRVASNNNKTVVGLPLYYSSTRSGFGGQSSPTFSLTIPSSSSSIDKKSKSKCFQSFFSTSTTPVDPDQWFQRLCKISLGLLLLLILLQVVFFYLLRTGQGIEALTGMAILGNHSPSN